MSSTTLILVVKSLWPFLKEILLKDKGLREFLTQNKIATFLSACMLLVFALFIYTANLADKNYDEIARLKVDITHRDEIISQLKQQVPSTSGSGAPPTPVVKVLSSIPISSPVTDEPVITPVIPVKKEVPVVKPTKNQQKTKTSESLKSYVESRLKKSEQDGN